MASKSRTCVVIRRRSGSNSVTRTEVCPKTRDRKQKDVLKPITSNTDVIVRLKRGRRLMKETLSGAGPIESTLTRRADQDSVFMDAYRFLNTMVLKLDQDSHFYSLFGRIVQPPGTGKTVLMGEIIAATAVPTLILVPTLMLVDQIRQELRKQLPTVRIGVWSGSEKRAEHCGITIATYASLTELHKRDALPSALKNAGLILCDEAHESMTELRQDMLQNAFHPAALRIAFTATPDYSALRSLAAYFPELIHEITLAEAVKLGLMAKSRVWIYAVDQDGSHVKLRGQDYDEGDIGRLMSSAPFFRMAETLRYETDNNAEIPALICCTSKAQAYDLRKYLVSVRPKGERPPGLIVDETSAKERRKLLGQFERGTINTLITVGVLLRGWNSPRCKLLIDMAPTRSLVRAKQKFFRPLRVFGDAVAKIYLLLPQDLPEIPVFPSDFFGASIEESTVGELAKQRLGHLPSRVDKYHRTPIDKVWVCGKYLYEDFNAFPDLNPRDDDQLREVIGSVISARGRVISWHAFRRLRFYHHAFSGSGTQLLRYCGVRDRTGYLRFVARLFPDAATDAILKPKPKEQRTNASDLEHVQQIIDSGWRPTSLEQGIRAIFGDDEPVRTPEEVEILRDRWELVEEVLATLTPREEYIITHMAGVRESRWTTQESYDKIGARMCLTRERIRQIEREGYRKLRKRVRNTTPSQRGKVVTECEEETKARELEAEKRAVAARPKRHVGATPDSRWKLYKQFVESQRVLYFAHRASLQAQLQVAEWRVQVSSHHHKAHVDRIEELRAELDKHPEQWEESVLFWELKSPEFIESFLDRGLK